MDSKLTGPQALLLRALYRGATMERTNPSGDILTPAYRVDGLPCDPDAVEGLEAAGFIQLRSPDLLTEYGYSLYTLSTHAIRLPGSGA